MCALACLQTFIVAPNVNYGDAACTDLSALAFGDYSYIGTEAVKCTAPGEGYMFNYPANVAGAPPPMGGQYFCVKFKLYGNTVKLLTWDEHTACTYTSYLFFALGGMHCIIISWLCV